MPHLDDINIILYSSDIKVILDNNKACFFLKKIGLDIVDIFVWVGKVNPIALTKIY